MTDGAAADDAAVVVDAAVVDSGLHWKGGEGGVAAAVGHPLHRLDSCIAAAVEKKRKKWRR